MRTIFEEFAPEIVGRRRVRGIAWRFGVVAEVYPDGRPRRTIEGGWFLAQSISSRDLRLPSKALAVLAHSKYYDSNTAALSDVKSDLAVVQCSLIVKWGIRIGHDFIVQ